MNTPHFLLADNTDFPDNLFIIHTQFPRFSWNINTDEIEWFDELEGEDEELVTEIANLMETAEAFYEREIQRHEADA